MKVEVRPAMEEPDTIPHDVAWLYGEAGARGLIVGSSGNVSGAHARRDGDHPVRRRPRDGDRAWSACIT